MVSLLATLYFGKQCTSEVNPKLIIPKLRKYLKPYKYSEVPMDVDKMAMINSKELEALGNGKDVTERD